MLFLLIAFVLGTVLIFLGSLNLLRMRFLSLSMTTLFVGDIHLVSFLLSFIKRSDLYTSINI